MIMKAIKQSLKIRALAISAVALSLTVFSSCCHHADDYVCPAPGPLAYVSVVNGLPGSQPVNFQFDNNEVNYYGIPYGGGLDYINVCTGKREISVYDSQNNTKITSGNADLSNGNYYSVFLTGTPAIPDLLVLNDDIKQPQSGNAGVRLVNLSSDAPAVDLIIQQGPSLATNVAYKGSSTFTGVSGANSYNIEIHQTGTGIILASLQNVRFRNGSLYTVILEGHQTTNDGHVLSIKIQTNAGFTN
jgi:Domain of unknown function (DUF4397)